MKLHHRSQSKTGTGKDPAEGIATTSTVSLDLSPCGHRHVGSGAEQQCGACVCPTCQSDCGCSCHAVSLFSAQWAMSTFLMLGSTPRRRMQPRALGESMESSGTALTRCVGQGSWNTYLRPVLAAAPRTLSYVDADNCGCCFPSAGGCKAQHATNHVDTGGGSSPPMCRTMTDDKLQGTCED